MTKKPPDDFANQNHIVQTAAQATGKLAAPPQQQQQKPPYRGTLAQQQQ